MDTNIVYFLVAVPVLLGALSGLSSTHVDSTRRISCRQASSRKNSGRRNSRVDLPTSTHIFSRIQALGDEGNGSQRNLRAAVVEMAAACGRCHSPRWESPDKS